jgi:hypothetical protein
MVKFDFYISEEQLRFLVGMGGKTAEHIRRAIDEYIEKKKNSITSSSKS